MNKNTFSITAFLLGIVLLITGFVLMGSGSSGGLEWKSNWSWDISVQNGVANKDATYGNFTVEKAGTYTLHLSWNPSGKDTKDVTEGDVGFVTCCVLTDEQGKLIYSSGGLAGDVSPELELTAGNYHLDYWYMTTRKDFQSFAATWLCAKNMVEPLTEQYQFEKLPKDGTWTMEYFLHADSMTPASATNMLGLCGIVLGACLILLSLLTIVKKKGLALPRYDERQELEQGRGYRYAFFTTLVAVGATLFIDLLEDLPARNVTIFYTGSILLGIIVYVIYSLWHDCYIALNEKRGAEMAIIGAIGVINLILGLPRVLSEGLYDSTGRVSNGMLNLMCAVMAFVILVAGVIQSIVSRHNVAEDEEDEA